MTFEQAKSSLLNSPFLTITQRQSLQLIIGTYDATIEQLKESSMPALRCLAAIAQMQPDRKMVISTAPVDAQLTSGDLGLVIRAVEVNMAADGEEAAPVDGYVVELLDPQISEGPKLVL